MLKQLHCLGRSFLSGDESCKSTTCDVLVRKGGARAKVSECHWKNCIRMSTLFYHPLEIDCITFKNVAPRINRDALFQERRW